MRKKAGSGGISLTAVVAEVFNEVLDEVVTEVGNEVGNCGGCNSRLTAQCKTTRSSSAASNAALCCHQINAGAMLATLSIHKCGMTLVSRSGRRRSGGLPVAQRTKRW